MPHREDLTGSAPAIRAALVVPAYNEEESIARCLDAIASAPLPGGVVWSTWYVVDDSTDATAAVVRGWASAHPERDVLLLSGEWRAGKAHALELCRRRVVEQGSPSDLLVGVDADVEVDPSALQSLLAPFCGDRELAAAWGCARPRGERSGRRASWFQMELVRAAANAAGPGAVRAEGRIWALRPSALPAFSWQAGEVVDDLQLAAAVADARARSCSAPQAIAWTRPARGWMDFHRQTQRSRRSRRAQGRARATSASPGATVTQIAAAVAAQVAADPIGGAAYAAARAVSALGGAWDGNGSLAAWNPARSTKQVRPGVLPSVSLPAKARLGLRVVQKVANWPMVLARYGLARVDGARWGRGSLEVHLRDGRRVRGPANAVSCSPIFEVLIGDAYRVGLLDGALARPPETIIDVGAHVGSAALALARLFPMSRVICAEPSASARTYLQGNLAGNGVSGEVVPAAVGRCAGRAVLFEPVPGSCESAVEIADGAPSEGQGRRAQVPVVGMRELLARAAPAVLVKLDCEGSEYEIVAGTTPQDWREVVGVLLEYHYVEGSGGWPLLAEWFTAAGLLLLWHDPDPLRAGLGMACFVRPAAR